MTLNFKACGLELLLLAPLVATLKKFKDILNG